MSGLINEKLKWTDHIEHVYDNIVKFFGVLYKIRNKIPFDILKQLYFSHVHSQINYAIELYLNTSWFLFDKICKFSNKILRILRNKHPYFPIVELYNNFNALPALTLHEQQIFILLHTVLHIGHLGGTSPKKWSFPQNAPRKILIVVSNILLPDCMSFPCSYWHSAACGP